MNTLHEATRNVNKRTMTQVALIISCFGLKWEGQRKQTSHNFFTDSRNGREKNSFKQRELYVLCFQLIAKKENTLLPKGKKIYFIKVHAVITPADHLLQNTDRNIYIFCQSSISYYCGKFITYLSIRNYQSSK